MPRGYSKGVKMKPPTVPLRPVLIPIGPSIAYVQLTQGHFSLIDREDAAWVGQWNWRAIRSACTRDWYAVGPKIDSPSTPGRKRIVRLHSALLGVDGTILTADHIVAGNALDNRRCNLRIANRYEQSMNRRKRSDNSTGVKGVFRARKKWGCQISSFGQQIYLGLFDTLEAAREAYAEAAKIEHGQFRCVD